MTGTPRKPSSRKSISKSEASESASEAQSLGMLGSSVSNAYTFTARTCLSVLDTMSDEDVNFEFQRLSLIDKSFSSNATKKAGKCAVLRRYLTKQCVADIDDTMNTLTARFNTFSCTVENECTKLVDRITKSSLATAADFAEETTQLRSLVSEAAPALSPIPTSEVPELDTAPANPVRVLECDLSEFSVDDLSAELEFDTSHPGGRRTTYYGSLPYSYGRTTHSATNTPLPSSLVRIYDKLKDIIPNLTPENYSCLCTYYRNGTVGIPMHQDSEPSIVEDSDIYTISFGATRVFRVSNTTGHFVEHSVPLEHGSVICMSRASQDNWRHGIDRDPLTKLPRISLTLRKLQQPQPPAQPEQRPQIPPVAPPKQAQQNFPTPRHSRVLFIHDSIHRDTTEGLFDQIPGHSCVKRVNYQLADALAFESEFKHAKSVVISCGINDLARYGKSARSLADIFCPRFIDTVRRNKATEFVFCSLTLTRNKWLNDEITEFNHIMFDLARDIPNLSYFDADRLIRRLDPYTVWERNDRHGIHLSFDVRRIVAQQLVNCVGKLAGSQIRHHRNCEWLFHHVPNSLFRYHRG